MDSQYRPEDNNMADNRLFSPKFDRAQPIHIPDQSGQTSRTNTWVQTPNPPYSGPQYNGPQYTSEPAYFNGQNGYPMDLKGKQPYEVNERSVEQTPTDTPRDSIDLEKQKQDIHAEPHDPHMKDPNQPKIPFGQRIKHFTWAWYTLTMSTGGVATLISVQPHPFPGLLSIGAFFYVLNLIMFATLCTLMITRFAKFPGSFKESIKHEREGLFLGPFFLSVATIITSTQKYVVQAYDINHPTRGWMVTSISIAFWLYTFLTFCLAVFQYSFLFVGHTYMLTKFMPSWLLPIFPIMLAGTIASTIAADQPIESRMPILVAGLGCQGLGFTVAILMYAHYIGRLMQVGLPNREHRPAMFIGVGPPSFTCLALIGMANALPKDFDLQGDGLLDGNLLRTMALVVALFLWVLAMWFFMIALVATLHSRPKYFHLGWWAMVFPNTGFVIATISIGKELKDETILFVGNGLTIAILVMWVFVLFCNLRAVWVVDIMYPGRDEDVED